MIQLGKIAKPHGLKGELKIVFWGDLSLEEFSYFYLLPAEFDPVQFNNPQRFYIEQIKFLSKGAPVVKFKGINSREQADDLRKHNIYLKAEEFPEIEDEEFYLYKMEGFKVVTQDKKELGTITGFMESSTPYPMMIVKDPNGQERIYPLPPPYLLEFNPENSEIVVDEILLQFTNNRF